MAKLAKKSKKLDQYDLAFKQTSLTGRAGETIRRVHPALIKIIMPDAVCGPWVPDEVLFGPDATAAVTSAIEAAQSKEAAEQRFAVRGAWHEWGECWKLLNKPMDHSDSSLHFRDVWAARAEEVQVATKLFVTKHIAAVGMTEGLYLHILHRHVADQIRRRGDLRVRQSQGLEHCHKIRKTIGVQATNRKPGQRLETMLTHTQVLAYLRRLQSESFYASEHARNKGSKLRRLAAKIERVNATMPRL
jgi:hypothetical protein